jgi:hypothetical protein
MLLRTLSAGGGGLKAVLTGTDRYQMILLVDAGTCNIDIDQKWQRKTTIFILVPMLQ